MRMTDPSATPQDPAKKDCDCGCGGDCGDKTKAGEPSNRARRALVAGAGSALVIVTLSNRRAFASGGGTTGGQCGPISAMGSMNPSAQNTQGGCGGLTPGFWKNHAPCVATAIGGNPTVVTLGQKLTNLALVDPTDAAITFAVALCNNVYHKDNAFHWAAAILNALTPSMNPKYGYTIASLNAAILTAHNQGVSGADILSALTGLENDFGTNDGGCTNQSICPS